MTATTWRLALRNAPPPARFDDGALVFNPLTWDTHLLNPAATQIMDALRTAPCDSDALASALLGERETDAEERAAYAAQVAATLAEMAVIGLVERDDPPR
jgi:PqqD family protein of HPr-rel-A system